MAATVKKSLRTMPNGIVKVQVSMFSSQGAGRYMLVYNENHTVYYESVATQEVLDLMAGDVKAYCYYRMDGDDIELMKKAPNQPW